MPQLLRSLLAGWLHVLAGRATRLEETLVMRAQAAVAFDDSDRPTRGGRATPGHAGDGRTLDGAPNSHTATERRPGHGTGDGLGIDGEEFAGPPPRHWLAQVRGNPPAHWPGAESPVPAPAPAGPSVDPADAVASRHPSGWDRPRRVWAEFTRRAQGALDGWQRSGRTEGKPTLPAVPAEGRRPVPDPTADASRTDAPAADRPESTRTRDSRRPSEEPTADSVLPNVPPADSDQKPAGPPVEPPPGPDDLSAQAKWTASPWDRRSGGRAPVDVPAQREPADPPRPHHDQPHHDQPRHDRPRQDEPRQDEPRHDQPQDAPPHDVSPYDRPPHDRRPPTHPRAPGWFWIPTGPDLRVPTDDANPPATDPWPALPDDEPLWIPPDTAFSDSDQLRRLDDEQRGS